MRQRKIVAIFASAVLTTGLSAAISGCADHPPESRPIMYGTNGNRGVTAPSQGVPQNTSNPLGGSVTSSPGSDRTDQTIVGTSAGVDATGQGTVGVNENGNRSSTTRPGATGVGKSSGGGGGQ